MSESLTETQRVQLPEEEETATFGSPGAPAAAHLPKPTPPFLKQPTDKPTPFGPSLFDSPTDKVLNGTSSDEMPTGAATPPKLSKEILENLAKNADDAQTAASPVPFHPSEGNAPDSSGEDLELDEEVVEEAMVLGRYTRWEELGAGGMATVHRATAEGPGGVVRQVALKLVHPHLAKHPTFVQMFLDEARVVSRIVHPNVCGVVDFGEVDGTYFMAMEYLEGRSLFDLFGELSRRPQLRKSKRWVALAARMVGSGCEGLHAAHELSDETGRPLRVVHRDVSPQNLFVTYNGAVKVMDFGVAFSEGRRSAETQPGVIKGKYGYVSPEQLAGKIDRRVDIWSAGVCLWELLSGERLFAASTALETISRVATGEIPPPSRFNPSVPPALDEIVLRALSRDPKERFATARRLGMAIDEFLSSFGEPTSMVALAQLMREVFPANAPQSQVVSLDEGENVVRIAPTAPDATTSLGSTPRGGLGKPASLPPLPSNGLPPPPFSLEGGNESAAGPAPSMPPAPPLFAESVNPIAPVAEPSAAPMDLPSATFTATLDRVLTGTWRLQVAVVLLFLFGGVGLAIWIFGAVAGDAGDPIAKTSGQKIGPAASEPSLAIPLQSPVPPTTSPAPTPLPPQPTPAEGLEEGGAREGAHEAHEAIDDRNGARLPTELSSSGGRREVDPDPGEDDWGEPIRERDSPVASPELGRLVVTVRGSWAIVREHGRALGHNGGETPVSVNVPAGRHVLSVYVRGQGPPQRMVVRVRPGRTSRLVVPTD